MSKLNGAHLIALARKAPSKSMRIELEVLIVASIACLGCRVDSEVGSLSWGGYETEAGGDTASDAADDEASTDAADEASPETESAGSEDDDDGATKFDIGEQGDQGDDGPIDPCVVVDDESGVVGDCDDSAPPGSFDPDIQWSFTPPGHTNIITIPLVANMTDDDDNGTIDLCDVPDVVVIGTHFETDPGTMYLLDGETGQVHFEFAHPVIGGVTPALGDIDGDGLVEVVAAAYAMGTSQPRLAAFEHDGALKWLSDTTWDSHQDGAIALADVDNDGDVEIAAGVQLFDHEGAQLWANYVNGNPLYGHYSATTMADLDGDEDLEILVGHAAFEHDGALIWEFPEYEVSSQWGASAHAQVADLDDDGAPEVIIAASQGLTLIETDGSVVYQDQRPSGEASDWNRPLAIHDFDMDGGVEMAVSTIDHFAVYDPSLETVFIEPIGDWSGQAGGTAFDFLGSGTAQAIYGGEQQLYVFDDVGNVLMQVPRHSATWIEYPVVADIDNDGSAELLITTKVDNGVTPVLQAYRDVEDRWVPARRIWNQHTYHVTNVREDGTIPQVEPKHWTKLNTFRTQAQIGEGGICDPVG
ncbi:FG-GAP repeat/HVR domain protein [Plesiocystis pacifica SIR-1]|uniref:FG-GAP repeat/HVR domain protein n=2 Tax=Plesiocystis pacifica TaxID=191768 RepID=A6FZA2_9BACT|nr:FG-GAP repeat/HVR domain protein [Plesiocystis pacifica SIR-1]